MAINSMHVKGLSTPSMKHGKNDSRNSPTHTNATKAAAILAK